MSSKIKAMMVLRGVKQVDICRKLRVKPGTVSMVVSGKKTSNRIMRTIARALGVRVKDLKDLYPTNNSRHRVA